MTKWITKNLNLENFNQTFHTRSHLWLQISQNLLQKIPSRFFSPRPGESEELKHVRVRPLPLDSCPQGTVGARRGRLKVIPETLPGMLTHLIRPQTRPAGQRTRRSRYWKSIFSRIRLLVEQVSGLPRNWCRTTVTSDHWSSRVPRLLCTWRTRVDSQWVKSGNTYIF